MSSQVKPALPSDDLIDEVRRYLTAIEVFRTAGYEPHWQPESKGGKHDDQ